MRNKFYSIIIGATLAVISGQALAIDITFGGVVREFIEKDDITGGTTDSKPGVKLTSFMSKFNVYAVEPLNDVSPGLKMNLKVETAIFGDSPTTNTTVGGTAQYRGIVAGGERFTFGFANDNWSVEAGRDAHYVWKVLRKYGPFQDFLGSPVGEIHNRQKLRMNNGIYSTYSPAPGLTLVWDHGFSEVADRGDSNAVGFNYKYQNLEVATAYYNEGYKQTGMIKNNESLVYMATYSFPTDTSLTLLHSRDTYLDKDSNGTTFLVKQKLDPKVSVSGGVGYRPVDNVTAYFAGADYILSRHVTLQARVQKVSADNAITFNSAADLAGISGKDRLEVGVGMEVKF